MGKINIVISIIAGLILSVFMVLSFVVPFVAIPILIAFVSLIGVSFYLLKEDRSLAHRTALKNFYCPFRKMIVDAKFRPSLFMYRTYDDVLKCSAFKGRVTCQKRCLDMPEMKYEHRPVAVMH
jgi:hypothetical protein